MESRFSSRIIRQAAILARLQGDDDAEALSKVMRFVSDNLKNIADEIREVR